MSTNDLLSNAIATAVLAVVAAIGGKVNSWLAKKKNEAEDIAVAREKIRALEASIGAPSSGIIQTIDDVFKAIRSLESEIKTIKKG